MLVAFRALRNLQSRQRRWVTAKFLRHKRDGLENLIQLYRTDTFQDQLLFRIRLVGQKEFVDVSYAFYDLGWLPVGHPNIQKQKSACNVVYKTLKRLTGIS